jgi:hypothetical protein
MKVRNDVACFNYSGSAYEVGLKMALFGMPCWIELIGTIMQSRTLQEKTKCAFD